MNIAEILKDAPKGTKLYSPIFGEVYLTKVTEGNIIVETKNGVRWNFTSEGKIFACSEDTECLLFPSKEQRDWVNCKIKPQFPTTIDRCSELLDLSVDGEDWYKEDKIGALRKLLIARDAWWKMDNDWKPDWKGVYDCTIATYKDKVKKNNSFIYANRILTFRTPEIRDKFLDTFRDLIEQCKKLI